MLIRSASFLGGVAVGSQHAPLKNAPRSIFRADAIKQYLQRHEESVLPRFLSPPTFACLSVLMGLLIVSGLIACLARVPVYVFGPCVVIDRREQFNPSDDCIMVVLLPPESLLHLREGQTLFIRFEESRKRVRGSVTAVKPEIISAEDAQRRFGFSAAVTQAITQRSIVALARLESTSFDIPASTCNGSGLRAEVEVGSRRLISFLPLID
jgi:hypothetical protein